MKAPWNSDVPEFSRRGLFPTREQFLVLKAALGGRDEALAAYGEWRRTLDVSREFDHEVFRLVPLLYDNLRRHGVEDDLTGRLKGAYRMSWVKAHRLAAETKPILDEMTGAGLEVLALKGAPLGLLYYGNPALRPMGDFDFVVRPDEARRAVSLVEARGYVPWRAVDADVLRYRHAMGYKRADGHEFDLHWHVVFDFCDDAADAWFWQTSVPFELLGHRVRTLDATRTLLHTLVHGIRWNEEPPVRWIADAMVLLRQAAGEIDWPALLQFGERRGVARRLWLGLTYLRDYFDAPVPDAAIARLGRRRASWLERLENRTILRSFHEVHAGALGPLLCELAPFGRYARGRGPLFLAAGFPDYLRHAWQLGSRAEIPGYLARRFLKRLGKGLRPVTHATT
ncbi:MAG: nucleotidyltransferase family protein [Steroidobacteraceae bacterium]|nr:nucleotidyltransferase family protein [Steroidobacteraceae bacterium]